MPKRKNESLSDALRRRLNEWERENQELIERASSIEQDLEDARNQAKPGEGWIAPPKICLFRHAHAVVPALTAHRRDHRQRGVGDARQRTHLLEDAVVCRKTRRRRMTITNPDLLHCLTLELVAVVARPPLGLLALKRGAKHLQI